MDEKILLKEYQNLCKDVQKVYVVPLIDYSLKKTNYLYLLYKDFIEENQYNIQIESLSIFAHPKIFFSKLINNKSVLHYHWLEINDLESFFGMIWKLFWISLYRFFNGKIVWTVHNKFPHSNKFIFLNKIIRRYMAIISNRLHVHCKSAVGIMSQTLSVQENKFFIVNHPKFPSIIFDRDDAQNQLLTKYPLIGIKKEDKLFLMFGEIAKYKGIREVVEIFNSIDKNKKLLIMGKVKKGNEEYFNKIVSAIKDKDRVFIYGSTIPEEDVPILFNSSDYVLLNYKDVLTSGSVFLALSYNKNIVIPAKGCLKELSGEHVVSFRDEEELKNILIKY